MKIVTRGLGNVSDRLSFCEFELAQMMPGSDAFVVDSGRDPGVEWPLAAPFPSSPAALRILSGSGDVNSAMRRSRFAHYVLPLLLAVLAVALPASAEWKE